MTTPDASQRARSDARDETARSRPSHLRRHKGHKVRHAVALSLTGVLAFLATGAGAVYYKIQNNIETVDVSNLVNEAERPAAPTPDPEDPNKGVPVNILLIGSDDRGGDNSAVGGGNVEGMRSDTTMVMHISADRSRVEVVSIPRDSLVALPSCETTNGTVPARKSAMFNSAFASGWDKGLDLASAAACTQRAVESLTDIRLNGFIIVDFAGFESMVNAIGGVPITLDEPIVSPMADLDLPAGEQVLDGQQALGLARARKGVGLDGSDLRRIDRQQDLVKAMAQSALDKNILLNAPQLMSFLNAATSSLKTSPEFDSIPELSGLALSLKGISLDDINFQTVPIATAPSDKNRVVWTSAATTLWERMRDDLPIDGSDPAAPPATGESETPETPLVPVP